MVMHVSHMLLPFRLTVDTTLALGEHVADGCCSDTKRNARSNTIQDPAAKSQINFPLTPDVRWRSLTCPQ